MKTRRRAQHVVPAGRRGCMYGVCAVTADAFAWLLFGEGALGKFVPTRERDDRGHEPITSFILPNLTVSSVHERQSRKTCGVSFVEKKKVKESYERQFFFSDEARVTCSCQSLRNKSMRSILEDIVTRQWNSCIVMLVLLWRQRERRERKEVRWLNESEILRNSTPLSLHTNVQTTLGKRADIGAQGWRASCDTNGDSLLVILCSLMKGIKIIDKGCVCSKQKNTLRRGGIQIITAVPGANILTDFLYRLVIHNGTP